MLLRASVLVFLSEAHIAAGAGSWYGPSWFTTGQAVAAQESIDALRSAFGQMQPSHPCWQLEFAFAAV